jgi:DNA-3-methyladenine glycosylase I
MMTYCKWDKISELYKRYHDEEWGVPLHDDRMQFEFLMMEAMQCGLSWKIIIQKREIFKKCFDNFEYDKVAGYDESDIARIMSTDGMIKSRRKIEAVINNAKCFKKIREEFGSFCKFLWAYSGGKTILYEDHEKGWIPASNGLSDRISKDLKRRGFKFLGPTTVYSHLQACGIINDHGSDCECYQKIIATYPIIKKPKDDENSVRYFGEQSA